MPAVAEMDLTPKCESTNYRAIGNLMLFLDINVTMLLFVGMEARGSCLLFGRSLDKHKLRYIPFVGDGDSKSYTEVCKLVPYGPAVYIPKEDCIAHVTKRIGTALRKLTTTHKGEQICDSALILH